MAALELYEALAALRDTASRLEAALPRLGGALERSLDAYEVRDSRDPARSVAACRARLDTAAELFGRAAVELDAAQNDIRDQGHA
ncbi:hypothetical protein [Lolliginicoccus levis]|uniref:hypothetical protein n=1 Tax=Lolliginicoccus levis TaxID=2919542 RepID=UPI00242037F1|nr:hypothetical protein [Lolliginicoccus levis]